MILVLSLIVASSIIVRVAAFMLELTGIPWEQSKFQALSAFSTAGFTTRESEQIVQHPLRRRIIGTLIVLGNAGIVTTVGTFAGAVSKLELAEDWPMVVGVMVSLFVLILLSRWRGLMDGLRRLVQGFLKNRYDFDAPRADELLRLDQGYDLTRLELTDSSPVVGKTLIELDMKSWQVQILAIEREATYKPVPLGREKLLAGDFVIVYGPENAIHKVFKPKKASRLTVMTN